MHKSVRLVVSLKIKHPRKIVRMSVRLVVSLEIRQKNEVRVV